MQIVYTVCSLNHIAQAMSLGHSLQSQNAEIGFVICLADRIGNRIDKRSIPFDIIEAEDVAISGFEDMVLRYNMIELNCALKPYFGLHILDCYAECSKIIYLDSDILAFHSLEQIFSELENFNIILTPHMLSSLQSDAIPDDRHFLNAGIYNAGFFAIRRSPETARFLEWWKEKLKDQGFIDFKNGMFVDQLWLNLVPLYFQGVRVCRAEGMNVAYWNLHERRITVKNKIFYVNENSPLLFYHFSGSSDKPIIKNEISKHQSRFDFSSRPDLIPLFKIYEESLARHGHEKYKNLSCYFTDYRRKKLLERMTWGEKAVFFAKEVKRKILN